MSERKDWHLSGLEPLDAAPGPSLRLSSQAADELADRIVSRALPRGGTRRRSSSRWLLPAAIVTATAAAAAGTWVMVRPARVPKHSPPASAVAPAAVAPLPSGNRGGVVRARPAHDVPLPEPSSSVRSRQRAAPAPPPDASDERAADPLREANQLRGQGHWADAERAYSQVMRSRPGSAQAYVATLAAASLRLEHLGDPRGALRLYESALQGGSLNVEAALGVARCHRALGNRAAEAEALRRALAAGAAGLLRRQAEQRLRDLEPGPP